MAEIPKAACARVGDVNEQVLHSILEIVSDGLWDWNANTGYVYRSPGWYEMLGYTAHSLTNDVDTWESVIHPDDLANVMRHFDDYIHKRSARYQVEYRCRCKDGSYLLIEDRARVIARNTDGSVARMVGAHRVICARNPLDEAFEQRVAERTRELRQLNEALRRQLDENRRLAETDNLTRVANRHRLEQVLCHQYKRAQRFQQSLSLIAMDMDDLKRINDAHGHSCGDLALITATQAISLCIREVDTLARWGGDEFMLVLPGACEQEALSLAARVRERLLALPPIGSFSVAMSFGVVQLGRDETQEQLLLRADRALYRSKSAGKNAISSCQA
ncbi:MULTISPECIES: sensor domain-containing diguanylate cyclase [unclassified Pseudomonas]|uniref:sensor domain-containing diguanylate cyclase n=1 Tax=unclassified Pseudomonas TaxID=196821 RepID=UPI000BCB8F2A|nr:MULTISPECIES: sensor domain-containing diguanylate cyclase [unclassified Pseudomonas]PVZ13758.1 PAS domain S-box-containing protein/diguanylate cyclase (GGDEF)-like protein [Pseudomonas sp. URIL14HWK12:I12]PVZ24064.1 PAS domain S-box-containing protein/diguanylate cyclase (GGDEF)-like protein [Pseudomonas sp. URIL14HWK12:I10]PVZ33297.1 PAS domain S-box-containing protein/diguanylate cyclase (GGDEF)-like protein [Pseudomonas sp. URIL14HWK12:I11]SNZ11055.1 PAS domain S-box-containing protein/d